MTDQKDPILGVNKKQDIVYLTLNRPHVLNALSYDLLIALSKELDRIKKDTSVKGILITGSGDKAFSAGADIEFLNSATPIKVRELAELAISVNSQIENLGKISIALINGFALGGGLELAESCMLRIAARSAKLGHPEVKIGVVAGWGGTTRLPRLVGKGRAAELLLTGRMIPAEKALEIGLVNLVVDNDKLQSEGEQLMHVILENAPVSVIYTWEAIHRGLNLSLEESAKLGADYFGLVASTEDFQEGTDAFLNKRKPSYKGR